MTEVSTAVLPHLVCLGLNHRSAAIELRERVYIGADELAARMPELKQQFSLLGLFVLSTCNRFELYVASAGRLDDGAVAEVFASLQEMAGRERWAPRPDDTGYIFRDVALVEHAFSVCASLDSLVIGETQITKQFKEALALASSCGCLAVSLDRLGQEALALAKQVRSRTEVGKRTVSLSHAAIELAKNVFHDLSARRFLFVGAGEMAQLAANYAARYQPLEMHVLSRRIESAQRLAGGLSGARAHAWERLEELLGEVDVVVSATAAPRTVISRDMVERAQRQREGDPLYLVDLALPRDVDSAARELDDVYLFEVDDLKRVVEGNLSLRRRSAEEARGLVRRAAERYMRWFASAASKPTLRAFRDYVEGLVEREMEKSLGRAVLRTLDDAQRRAIEDMTGAMTQRIVADAARALNAGDDDALREEMGRALRRLVGVRSERKRQGATYRDVPAASDDAPPARAAETPLLRL